MFHDMSVMFLGTGSGGGPSNSRNCSSLVMDVVGDGSLWMVDCAEGTTRQFEQQPYYGAQRYKRGRLTNIFITHMHADHTMGIIGLLKNLLAFPKPNTTPTLKVQLFGPAGVRNFIRSILSMTDSKTMDRYVVHELLRPNELPSAPCTPEALPLNEASGMDVYCGEDGFWREFTHVKGRHGRRDIAVDASPIAHRAPCIGYVVRESQSEQIDSEELTPSQLRKIVVLGDTNSPAAMIPLINSSPGHVALLVHEATDCYIPRHIDPDGITGQNRTPDSVHKVSVERGHSTPAMAGDFAKAIAAERLFLNHIGGRFPAPTFPINNKQDGFKLSVLTEIENQATQAWSHPQGARAVAASDFRRIIIPPLPKLTELELGVEMGTELSGVRTTRPSFPSSQQSRGGGFHRTPVTNSAGGSVSNTRGLSTATTSYRNDRPIRTQRRPRGEKTHQTDEQPGGCSNSARQ